MVRLASPWILRYPLIDFHGNMGNRDGDGPAAYRYTEARTSALAEDGMLKGIKKNNVDFIPNYDESTTEPLELPAIFPNLLCNPNSGIGVAIAANWLPHNLREVANAINDYIDGKEPFLPGPDFPTGGEIINKNELPSIIKNGHGSVKVRGRYNIEDNKIVFYELPYEVGTEALMEEIGSASDNGKINHIISIRNESNKKGFRLVIECEKDANLKSIINQLFRETKLQTSVSYNQVALVNKTPTELGLKDCLKIYTEHNSKCIVREAMFDIKKATNRLHIIIGLLKALDIIDDIIKMIKASESSAKAKETLILKYNFSEEQAKAILDMKLAKLAKLEKEDLEVEKKELEALLIKLKAICENPIPELKERLSKIVEKYGDERRTILSQIEHSTKEEKEIELVEPEKCVVIMTEAGNIKRIPTTSFKTQRRGGKGVKTSDEIISATIRTNTIDNIMIFSDKGKMYKLLVNDIPSGTSSSKGTPIKTLTSMELNENPAVIYSIYRDTDAKFVLFVTKNGMVKKTSLEEYTGIKKAKGLNAISLRESDELAAVSLIKDEQILLATKNGIVIRFNSSEINVSSRMTYGTKGIGLKEGDEVVAALPIRNTDDKLAIFATSGMGKKLPLNEVPRQKHGGKGMVYYKPSPTNGELADIQLVSDEDNILITGSKSNICIKATDIPEASKTSIGNVMFHGGRILSVTKV